MTVKIESVWTEAMTGVFVQYTVNGVSVTAVVSVHDKPEEAAAASLALKPGQTLDITTVKEVWRETDD